MDGRHDLIGEPNLADAILNRIVHNPHRPQLGGGICSNSAPRKPSLLDRTHPVMERSHPCSRHSATPADIKSQCPAEFDRNRWPRNRNTHFEVEFAERIDVRPTHTTLMGVAFDARASDYSPSGGSTNRSTSACRIVPSGIGFDQTRSEP